MRRLFCQKNRAAAKIIKSNIDSFYGITYDKIDFYDYCETFKYFYV